MAITDRTQLRRKAERGSHDRAVIDAILDEALVCHVGVVVEGQPFVIPTAFARVGGLLYLHGAAANHALRAMASGAESCVTVSLLDGLVLARSAFHHSLNYRSVVIFGKGRKVDDDDEKLAAVLAIVEHLVPGRSADSRPPTAQELRATLVVALRLDEASAKIRTGDPIEDPDDLGLGYWAGVVPLGLAVGEPSPAADLAADVAAAPPPDYVTNWRR
jgi:nitroimidazol reductase NimA-like FMN-containing flavoprotein (pyridoxamine 5'-phosphate oxidase superfamily)